MKEFQPDKLEPKEDKCFFIGHLKQLGIPPISDPEANVFVSLDESFLKEKFLSKELSGSFGGKLMRLCEPSLQPVCM